MIVPSSGVLAESLARSRQRWISEGLFERYWTKPHKRKGVLIEDPKNPPKDSMTKIGNVTITIEPHIVEATMYVVKGPKQKPAPQDKLPQKPQYQQLQQPARPIIQYGPANGAMPPPAQLHNAPGPMNKPTTSSPSPNPQHTQPHAQPPAAGAVNQHTTASPAARSATPNAAGVQRKPTPGSSTAGTAATPAAHPAQSPMTGAALAPTPTPPPSTPTTMQPRPVPGPSTGPPPQGVPQRASATPGASPAPAGAKPATTDPVIALLAQKASADPELRDLMQRVAVGKAKTGELADFQKIIDQLNAEYKNKGGQQGPSADRLLVDGRTVKYFADEVSTILDIVLASNPHQKSSELRPPPGSDPLVVLLVKKALEDTRTRDVIRSIAASRPGYTDATDLKTTLDRLNRDAKAAQAFNGQTAGRQLTPNGVTNNGMRMQQAHVTNHTNNQPVRSKAPSAPSRPDIAAVVFDFGAGDRFLFPKFSILEYLPTTSGQQVVASFLIVRKGSNSEYGGDPELDYYQPATIRLQTNAGRHLENLARVVAPQDEVRRYMDDVMDNMTRAEYVLLAMQLPRNAEDPDEDVDMTEAAKDSSPGGGAEQLKTEILKPGVLWTVSAGTNGSSETASRQIPRIDAEEESQKKYQRLIRSIEEKEYEYV